MMPIHYPLEGDDELSNLITPQNRVCSNPISRQSSISEYSTEHSQDDAVPRLPYRTNEPTPTPTLYPHRSKSRSHISDCDIHGSEPVPRAHIPRILPHRNPLPRLKSSSYSRGRSISSRKPLHTEIEEHSLLSHRAIQPGPIQSKTPRTPTVSPSTQEPPPALLLASIAPLTRKPRWLFSRFFAKFNKLFPTCRGLLILLIFSALAVYIMVRREEWEQDMTFFMRTNTIPPNGYEADCKAKNYRKRTLKLLRERPLADIYGTSQLDRFEASDISGNIHNDDLFIVMDNSFTIAKLKAHLSRFPTDSPAVTYHSLAKWPVQDGNEESDFEFIAYNATADRYILGQETTRPKIGGMYHAGMYEVSFTNSTTIIHRFCTSDMTFESRNKGFEGAQVISIGGKSFLLALCEGNHCSTSSKGKDSGNGRMVLLERHIVGDNCVYKKVGLVDIPSQANFEDYSAMSIYETDASVSRLAVVSQTNSALYLCDITAAADGIQLTHGKIYNFPRTERCDIRYCNIEGVYFLTSDTIITVSDRAKGGKQPFWCADKDESVHVFQIP